MNVTFETVICAWDEKIPALLIRLVNTLLFCRTEEEPVSYTHLTLPTN